MSQRAGILGRTFVILFVSVDLLCQILQRVGRQIRLCGLTLLLLLSASAVKADQYGDFTYITHNGTIIITRYTGAGGAVNIPSTIDGLPVTSIGDYAFIDGYLTSVTIPNSVTSIGDGAFYCCYSLTSVTIPNSVTSIGDSAFNSCDSLTAITVDASNSSYSSVDGVLFNKNQTSLIKCPGGKAGSYTIPNSVTSIWDDAFNFCTSLTSVTIPNSVTSIGDEVFSYCASLTSVTIGNSVISIGDSAFWGCASLTSVVIGNSVTSIGDSAFWGCASLTSITIPNSVTSIGYEEFADCTSLTAITVDASNSSYSSVDGVLFNKNQTTLIQYPGGKAGSYTIPNSVTSIGDYAFYDCPSLTSVTIPNSVTSIRDKAFWGCSSLTSITIPNSVTSIGDDAFYYCTGLTSVTIGNSVTSIGDEVFSYCASLTSVTIGSSVTSIGDEVFSYCASLTSVTIGSSVTSIGDWAFSGCCNLTGVYFLGNAPSLGSDAFYSDNYATVYYLAGTRGWGETFVGWEVKRKPFGGRPTALWQGIRGTVTAGSNGDSISFSSIMNATADDFNDANSSSDANFVEVMISDENSEYMTPCVITFPINGKTWKKGKFSYSGTENGIKKLFKYDVKTHGFTFTASKLDLSGLECPLTIDINVGNYTGTTEIDETLVNGRRPIPIKLLMGIKDSLRVDKSKFTRDRNTCNITKVAISGGFSDKNVNDTNLVNNPLDITVGSHTFTIPADNFDKVKNKFTCSKVKLYDGATLIGIATATFDFSKCTFLLTIKNTNFIDSGTVDFRVQFAGFSECAPVTLPY